MNTKQGYGKKKERKNSSNSTTLSKLSMSYENIGRIYLYQSESHLKYFYKLFKSKKVDLSWGFQERHINTFLGIQR